MTNQQKLTKKQKILLDYIDCFVTGHGFSPSYREIAEALGYRSIATVSEHINNLVNLGYLRKVDSSARSLELVGETASDKTLLSLEDQLKIRISQLDKMELHTVKKAFGVLKIAELEDLIPKNLDF